MFPHSSGCLVSDLATTPHACSRRAGWLHARIAVVSGVENGFAVTRAALRGNLTLCDDRGRIVAEENDGLGVAQFVGTVPLHRSHTPYARWGDWFACLDMALLLVVALRAVHRPSR